MVKNLRALRMEYVISQQRLADAIFVTQPSINKYENHNIEPEIAILIRMADFFDTSVDYLIGRTDVRSRALPAEEGGLSAEEAALLARYRSLSERERDCVQMVVRAFSNEEKKP